MEYPLSSEQDKLRTSLLPGLINVLKHNANHDVSDAAIFEIGRVFYNENGKTLEGWRLGIALTGHRFIWTYPKGPLNGRSIAVMSSNSEYSKEELLRSAGVCSDNVAELREMLDG